MKRSNPILIIPTLLLVALISTASAQPRKGLAARKSSAKQKMDKGLNLTEDQKTKMTDLRLANQKQMLPLQTELQGKMAELLLLKTEAHPDINKIDRLIEQSEKIRTKIQKAKARHQLEIRKILTPEQQKLWDSRALMGSGQNMMMGKRFRGAQARF
jgi:Spy/CpxP family protein refolding chaperone